VALYATPSIAVKIHPDDSVLDRPETEEDGEAGINYKASMLSL
jgi:hypothetical protein